ncbi:hypothetical protein SUGI_0932970 [Cryptomeria japonica]|nr:hypothetical protein SUGI_0932970 [Cryptomeria japonica]
MSVRGVHNNITFRDNKMSVPRASTMAALSVSIKMSSDLNFCWATTDCKALSFMNLRFIAFRKTHAEEFREMHDFMPPCFQGKAPRVACYERQP